jgi:hypothetical protein
LPARHSVSRCRGDSRGARLQQIAEQHFVLFNLRERGPQRPLDLRDAVCSQGTLTEAMAGVAPKPPEGVEPAARGTDNDKVSMCHA